MGGGDGAWPAVSRPNALRSPAAGFEDRHSADRRVPGAVDQEHLTDRHHRLHRTDPRRPDHQQRDVQALPGLRHRRGALLRHVLAALAAQRPSGTALRRPRPLKSIPAKSINEIEETPMKSLLTSKLRHIATGGLMLASAVTASALPASAETVDDIVKKGSIT